jgi:cold shock CspA family protein
MTQNGEPSANERGHASGTEGLPQAEMQRFRRREKSLDAVPLAAELVARLSAAHAITADDLPRLVENVVTVVRNILNPAIPTPTAETPAVPSATRRRGRPRGTNRTEPARKRGRPRKAAPAVEASPTPAVPAAPRLVRRSQAVGASPSIPSALEPPSTSVLRGVVRWFDPARRTGSVRLTGLPEDVAVDPEIFAAANITRLFKGQEIEAEIRRDEGRVQVASLRLPGGAAATSLSGPIAATGGRRPRIVIVEKKLDALKRVAARSEAEHVLGSRGTSKTKT